MEDLFEDAQIWEAFSYVFMLSRSTESVWQCYAMLHKQLSKCLQRAPHVSEQAAQICTAKAIRHSWKWQLGRTSGIAFSTSTVQVVSYVYIQLYNEFEVHMFIYIYMIFKASLPMTCCVALPFMGLDELFRQRSSSKRAAGESRGGEATEEEDTTSINQDQSKAALSVNHEPMSYQ